MANAKEYPVRFTPRGLSDAWDATDTFVGACRYLTNLIFAQTDPELVIARPGVGSGIVNLDDPNALIWGSFTWGTGNWSSGFLGATFISVQVAIGNLVYGMVSCTIYGAYDVPFCYDLNADQFIPVSGSNAGNLPASPAVSGDWVPPTMAVIGDQIIVTHPGYSALPINATLTASISGSELIVTVVTGTLVLGSNISGTDVPAGTVINGFIVGSGTFGGAGTYTLNNTVVDGVASESMTASSFAYFGVINIGNPQAPYYYATNTGIFPLPSVPAAVTNFNNRAYFACANSAYFSDVLFPTQMTNAGQALTLGDPTPIQGFCGLPIETTTSGVVGALIVFKEFQIWQITGDEAITGTLAQDFLSLTGGTKAPRSIVQTPVGTIFAGFDGPYFVSPLGQVLPLTNSSNSLVPDIQRPFQNIIDPSRAAAAFTGSIYRICMQTVIDGVEGGFDYWFDVTKRRWSGPHSFQYDCATQAGNYFVISGAENGPTLWASQYIPSLSSVYNDNGVALSVFLQSSMLPKTSNINQKQVIESTIELSTASASLDYTINSIDDHDQTLGTADITILTPLPTWGSFTWGDGSLWSQSNIQPWTYQVPWPAPLVFKKLAYQVSATSSYNLAIGTIFSKYRDCGYTNVIGPWSYVAPSPAPAVPAAPQNLTAVGENLETVESWTNVYNATSYNLYWSLTPGAGVSGTKISGITETTYTQTGLTNDVTYYYVVTAVNAAGESGPSNQASATPIFSSLYVSVYPVNVYGSIYSFGRLSNGQLSPTSPASTLCGPAPGLMVTTPDGLYVYSVDSSGYIYQFSRNVGTAVLTPLPAASITTPGNSGISIHPSGNYVYTFGGNEVYTYTVSENGNLVELSSVSCGAASGYVAVHPTGNFLYVVGGQDIFQFAISDTGVLSALDPPYVNQYLGCNGIAVTPNGNYLYSLGTSDGVGSVFQYNISENGTISIAGTPIACGSEIYFIAISPNGNNLYVPNQDNGTVVQYSIGSDGTLAALSPATVACGTLPKIPAFSPDGKYFYVGEVDSGLVYQFSCGTNGTLSELTPFTVGTDSTSITGIAIH